jgi:hypothetical protein
VYRLVFHAYVNEMHGSRSKISGKNLVRQRWAERFNYGVKSLILPVPLLLSQHLINMYVTCPGMFAEKITFGRMFLNIHSEKASRIFQVRTHRYVLGCLFVICHREF